MLYIIQIILAIVLTTIIVIQAKGTGLGSSFGQTSYHSKRGIEKTLFAATIIIAIIFVLISAINSLN